MRLLFPALALLFLIAWGPSLGGGFHFDDYSLLTEPLWRPMQTRPLTQATFWLSAGTPPVAYHLWNLLLHALNCWLAWKVLRAIEVPLEAAGCAVAIFALHPMQSEPVNYVFARSTLLMSAFCLGALWCWVCEREWIATALFGLALLAKEECVTFPLVLLLFDATRNRKRYAPVGAMLALALAVGLRTIVATAATPGAGAGVASSVTPLAYVKAQGVVILSRYLRMVFVPWGFTVDPQVADPGWVLGAAAWIVLLAGAWFAWKRNGFWVVCALVLLIPSSSIFPAEDLAADRRMYLPLLALAVWIAGLLPRRAMAPVVLLLAALSWQRSTQVWGSEETLWREACERSPAKTRPRVQLARVSAMDEATRLLNEAMSLAPADPDIPNELGLLLLRQGRAAEALGQFGKALALAPGDAKSLNNRGAALFQLGQTDAARQDFVRALTLDPCLEGARANLKMAGGSFFTNCPHP